jgi:hypothetical protein
VRTRDVLLLSVLSAAACDLRCSGESQVAVAVDEGSKPVVTIDGKVDANAKAGSEAKAGSDTKAGSEVGAEAKRTVEVEVEPTVCDAIDLEIERIVLVPADPPFNDVPRERVSIRITNGADRAVELDSGTDATFLDERRTLVKADLHQSEWFMPLTLPAKSATVVQIMVPEGGGKALRTVEVEASPAADPFTDCKVSDDLLGTAAPTTEPAAPAPTEPAPTEPAPGVAPTLPTGPAIAEPTVWDETKAFIEVYAALQAGDWTRFERFSGAKLVFVRKQSLGGHRPTLRKVAPADARKWLGEVAATWAESCLENPDPPCESLNTLDLGVPTPMLEEGIPPEPDAELPKLECKAGCCGHEPALLHNTPFLESVCFDAKHRVTKIVVIDG